MTIAYARWECRPTDGTLICRECGRPLPAADAHRDCRKLRDLRPKLPEPKPLPSMRPRDIRRRVRERRARLAAELVRRVRAVRKPSHRPLAQAELAAGELATSGKLDNQTCSRGVWNAVRDILDPALWRPEWGVCPVPIPPTHLLRPGQVPRVAFLNPVIGVGGTERWMADLIAGLHASGSARCEVVVVAGVKECSPAGVSHLEQFAPVHAIAREDIEAWLIAGGFHLAVAWGIGPLPAIVGKFRPNVICCHGSDTQFSAGYPRQARPVCERFVAVSRAALRPLEAAAVPPWQRYVIHNGVDRERVTPTAGAREIRLRLGLEASDFVCGFIGRFSPEKRADLLVDALQLLGDGYRGLLMGSGPMESVYRDRDQAGRCLFVEHSYEIGNALAVSDCFVGLTRDEGFWYSGAEAAIAGVPLVTTRVGFLQELADELRPQPWIEVPLDVTPQVLAREIERCRRQRPDTRRMAAAVGRWSVDRMCRSWADLIREAVPVVPTCSVLLSVRDTPAAMLAECWASIAGQTEGWELILVDDGSKDPATIAELDRIGADARVRLLRLENNVGLPAALNRGLAECRAELVARIDGDDVMVPGRLVGQMQYMADHAEVAIIGGQVDAFDSDTGESRHWPPRPAEVTAAEVDRQRSTGDVWLLNHPAVMFRRSAILGLGGYPEEYRRCQDLALWLRAIRAGLVIRNQADVNTRYRLHPSQMTGARDDHLAEHDLVLEKEWCRVSSSARHVG